MSTHDSSSKADWKKRFIAGLILTTLVTFAIATFPGFSKVYADAALFQTAAPLTTFTGTNLGAIPDNDCTGPGRQINFAVTGISNPLSNVRVGFTGTHTYVGDLDVRLTAPNGTTSATIFTFTGSDVNSSFGDSSDLGGTYTFFDTAPANWWAAAAAVGPTTAIPPGGYRSSDANGANTSLDPVFAGLANPNGTWVLRFNDCSQGDTGTITDATLSLNGVTATPMPTATPTGSPTPTPTPTATPTPTPTPTPTATPTPSPVPTLTPIPTPTPTGSPTPTPTNTFAGTNFGAIPDNDCSGPGRQIMFAVTGISTPISNLRVSFTGTHTYVGDLDVRLIAPNGTTSAFIFTFVGNGAGPSGDSSDLNGTYNFFDAAVNNFTTAAGLVGPTTAIAPGNYRASDGTGANISLDSVFANLANPNGTYILQFNDCAAGDTGSITAATLSFNGPTPTPLPAGGFEGDVNRQVAGVPGTGDGDVNVGDQIMYQRFLSGLDCPTVSPNEQRRLDAGPRSTLGDGLLGSADGTAIDAYARHDSSTDFDPNTPGWQPTPAGGPTAITNLGCTPVSAPEADNATATIPEAESASSARVVRLVSGAAIDRNITVEIEMSAQGNEAGTQYGLHFDPALVSISNVSGVNANPDIMLGADSPGGTTLNVNAEDAANGNIGIVENFNGANNSIEAIPAGARRIAKVTFHVRSGAAPGESKVTFDESVIKGVSADTNGLILSNTYDQTGIITVPATAGASISGRVMTPDGRGIRNATVTIVDRSGIARTVTTSSFGYYTFDDVAAGAYTVAAVSRQYRFATRTIEVGDNLADVNFVGLE